MQLSLHGSLRGFYLVLCGTSDNFANGENTQNKWCRLTISSYYSFYMLHTLISKVLDLLLHLICTDMCCLLFIHFYLIENMFDQSVRRGRYHRPWHRLQVVLFVYLAFSVCGFFSINNLLFFFLRKLQVFFTRNGNLIGATGMGPLLEQEPASPEVSHVFPHVTTSRFFHMQSLYSIMYCCCMRNSLYF